MGAQRLVLAAALLGALALVPASAGGTPRPALRPCVVQGVDARCGTVVVPENRARPGGRRIGLNVVVLPAIVSPARRDAFTYLAGGPGGAAASEMTASVSSIWSAVRAHRDVVLVDQRGTGGSHALTCRAPEGPVDTEARARAYAAACLRSLDGDPAQYGTVAAADDLEAVRVALGYRSFDVYGTSYGATLAQVYLNRHPRSVRTVVLDGGTLVDVPFYGRFAKNGQRALDRVTRRCTADARCAEAFPRWRAQLRSLIRKWNERPVRVGSGGRVGGDGLAGVVQSMTQTEDRAAAIPLVVSRAAQGDVEPLSHYVSSHGSSPLVMTWTIFCNEPWVGLDSRGPWGTYLDGYTRLSIARYRESCPYVPKHAERAADWKRPRSPVRLLALVGGADPQDPVGNLAGLRSAMPNSRIVVVPDLGHAIGQYGCLPRLVTALVERGTTKGLDTSCVRTIPLTPFALP